MKKLRLTFDAAQALGESIYLRWIPYAAGDNEIAEIWNLCRPGGTCRECPIDMDQGHCCTRGPYAVWADAYGTEDEQRAADDMLYYLIGLCWRSEIAEGVEA